MVYSKQRGPRYKSNQIILMVPLLNLDNLYCTYYQTSLITQMIWLVKHTVVLSSHIFRRIEPPPQTSVKREDEEKRQKAREGVLCGQSECLIHVLDRGHDPWVHVLVWVTAITAKPLTWERETLTTLHFDNQMLTSWRKCLIQSC